MRLVGLAGLEPATICLEDRCSNSAELQTRIGVKSLKSGVASRFLLTPDSELATHDFIVGARGRTQTFNSWFVGPVLYQLSYPGGKLAADGRG